MRHLTKTKNKLFKSKHSTKGSLKTKGKVLKKVNFNKKHELTKTEEKNRKKQFILKNKIKKTENIIKICVLFLLTKKTILRLSEDTNPLEIIKQIYKNLNLEFIENNNYIIEINKQKIKFITIQNNNIYQVMDATKISDFVMFVLSGKNQVDHFGDLCISTIKSQVIPSESAENSFCSPVK